VDHSHLTADDVALFVSGRLDGPALQRVLRQAAGNCRRCREMLRFYAPALRDRVAPPPDPLPADYDAALDAAFDRAEAGLARQLALQAEEEAGLARLRARGGSEPFDGDYRRFKNVARGVPGRARIEHILELSHEMRYRDPEKMWLLALGAASAAKNLGILPIDKGRYTPAQKADLRARTQIELANALRLRHSYDLAKDCLEEAAGLIEDGTGDLHLEGRLMDVYASLLMDERKLSEALDLLDKLHRHYVACGETHLAGRALIKKGIALHADQRHQEAVAALREGLAAVVPAIDPTLLATGQHTLVLALVEAGSFNEAGELLMKSGLRQAFAADPINLLKLRGVEGKIFAGLGKLWRAEMIFKEVKDEFLRRDREYLAAMLGLELAGVVLRQGRPDEVEELAEEALEIFQNLEVGREALKAVRYLREACRQRAATAELVQQVVRFLTRFEQQPELRFAP